MILVEEVECYYRKIWEKTGMMNFPDQKTTLEQIHVMNIVVLQEYLHVSHLSCIGFNLT